MIRSRVCTSQGNIKMILETEEAEARISSEHNLINRLKLATKSNQMIKKDFSQMYGIREEVQPFSSPVLPPTAEELIDDIGSKLKMGLAHDSALEVLCDSVDLLKRNLVNTDPTKPQILSKIAYEMSNIVHRIDEVRHGKNSSNNAPTIIYRPVMMAEANFEVINVHE